jgi:hypothetical protein
MVNMMCKINPFERPDFIQLYHALPDRRFYFEQLNKLRKGRRRQR